MDDDLFLPSTSDVSVIMNTGNKSYMLTAGERSTKKKTLQSLLQRVSSSITITLWVLIPLCQSKEKKSVDRLYCNFISLNTYQVNNLGNQQYNIIFASDFPRFHNSELA